MQRGFPMDLLKLVRCSVDGGELRPVEATEPFVAEGMVRCVACSRQHAVRDGILSLLAPELHAESAREMRARDERNELILDGTQAEWSSAFADAIEVAPTLGATGAAPGRTVLELGCGSGRYTLALAGRAASVVAVDLSRAGLRVLRHKLGPNARVALVQADVSRPYAAPRAFDRVLSTLHSNLPGRDYRMASLRLVAQALTDDGRGVISMHHANVPDTLMGVPAAGRYRHNGILRYYMSAAEARRESLPYFAGVRFVYVSTRVPGFRSPLLARALASVPLVRGLLAPLFLALCERPRREPDVDRASAPARALGSLRRSAAR